MYKVSPKTQLIFHLLNEKGPDKRIKSLILLSILKEGFLVWVITIMIGIIFHFSFSTPETQPVFILGYSFILTFMIIATIFYIIKKYTLSIKLYDFSSRFFDKSINEIANASDTFTSGYMVDYLCIETNLYDVQTVEIKDNYPISYGELRNQVLKVYRKSKSPKIPYQTEEYKNYMYLLQHALRYPLDQSTFRELYQRSKQ